MRFESRTYEQIDRARTESAGLLEQRLSAMRNERAMHDGQLPAIRRWEHEAVLDRDQQRLDRKLDAMTLRRSTIEHVFGTLKYWMGSTHF